MHSEGDRYRRDTWWPRPRPLRRRRRGTGSGGRRGRGSTARPRRRDIDPDADRARLSERAQFADRLDRELQLACRMEAMARRELGDAAHVFLRHHLYRRLGFVRLTDYARERLGVSARTVQAAAWMAVRLDALPAVSTAFDRSEISWTQARVICGVASPADEHRWLALAGEHTVEALTRIAKRTRPPRGIGTEPDPDANEIDGEPSIRWRLACPARVRALWRRARELASRMAGEPLADWQAAEIIAAEGFSGRPSGAVIADRVLVEAMRRARRRRRSRANDALPDADADAAQVPIDELRVPTDPPRAPGDALRVQPHTSLAPTDAPPTLTAANPFALDARLVAAMEAIRKSEP